MGHILEAEGLCQFQGQDPLAPLLFRDLSLRWEAPGLQVIMGPSGGGKSTLLRTLGGVWKPTKGRILFDGQPLWTAGSMQQDRKVLARIGFAFQNNALFNSISVIENLLLAHRQRVPGPTESERRAVAQSWLERLELGHTARQMPYELSGGMQKRLAIARTLMLQPDFIFLDDPTAGLDPITSRTIATIVSELLEGSDSLVVIVTNDPDRALTWGPFIHYFLDGRLISPRDPAYAATQADYL